MSPCGTTTADGAQGKTAEILRVDSCQVQVLYRVAQLQGACPYLPTEELCHSGSG